MTLLTSRLTWLNSSAASGGSTTAIGAEANASGASSTAVGSGATVMHDNSTAIGKDAKSTAANQVTIGGASSSVRIGDMAAMALAEAPMPPEPG